MRAGRERVLRERPVFDARRRHGVAGQGRPCAGGQQDVARAGLHRREHRQVRSATVRGNGIIRRVGRRLEVNAKVVRHGQQNVCAIGAGDRGDKDRVDVVPTHGQRRNLAVGRSQRVADDHRVVARIARHHARDAVTRAIDTPGKRIAILPPMIGERHRAVGKDREGHVGPFGHRLTRRLASNHGGTCGKLADRGGQFHRHERVRTVCTSLYDHHRNHIVSWNNVGGRQRSNVTEATILSISGGGASGNTQHSCANTEPASLLPIDINHGAVFKKCSHIQRQAIGS